ncbi:FGGY-family carbohydrate kinase [Kaistia dalseonensis]|uniref:Sugar (Pentulose or hexulose) kinase n=1 Tax=Kaistia dalseonensis TaxID=410840 RepID=A0ABU0H711_9HYPH|nr:FGGY-family carbohydrate kinase [Kaistia dalseonensis]MCX5495231.1 FGGY-family carbohydrate kinase [Kaistia dalseonensis]MDQ0437817.1 sugar (pentulose or hexulose) kinase [Kaistia dalseonensis]
MSRPKATIVLDIGKTNVKLALVDAQTRAIIAIRTTANEVIRDGLYPHFDTDKNWNWIVAGLKEFAAEAEIGCISTTTHGACAAIINDDGLVLPILDYEYDGPDSIADAYRPLRGAFWETLSPDLPGGLNIGRQLFWLQETFPSAFGRAKSILPYPQYWVWRLSGARVSEPTSLGCHSDLWNPEGGTFSRLAEDRGWAALIPKVVHPWDTAGTIRPELAAKTGLPLDCRVVAGIHDSNASLLPHILRRQSPFAVLSTGTWLIVFAVGGSMKNLDPARDCLANVDALGRPVPSARFMAGREFGLLTEGIKAEPTAADVASVVERGVMALPSFAQGTGPYAFLEGHWTVDVETLTPGERIAAASLYCALVADTCLSLTSAAGPVIVEGPLSKNAVFLSALARIVGRPVIARSDATGTTEGAALLADGPEGAGPGAPDGPPIAPLDVDLSAYIEAWREALD